MGQGYFGSHLSPNIIRLPNGQIVAKAAKLARTGWMDYTPAEINVDSPSPIVKVWRDPKDVFATSAIASFEGATVTDQHPPQFVDKDNWAAYARGVCQHVRRGNTYEDGEYLVGDLVLQDASLISKVDAGLRDVSAGYNYRLLCYDCKLPVASETGDEAICECGNKDQFQQVGILGNHIAVVKSGRAGGARIVDAAITSLVREEAKSVREEAKSGGGSAANNERNDWMKQKPSTLSGWRRLALGLGLKQLAATDGVEPEDLMDAAKAAEEPMEEPEKVATSDTDPGVVARNEEFNAEARQRTKERGKDDKGMKSNDEDKHPEGCRCQDCMDAQPPTVKHLKDSLKDLEEKLSAKKTSDAEMDPEEEEEGEGESMDSYRKSTDKRFAGIDATLGTIRDGLSRLLKDAEAEKPPDKPEPDMHGLGDKQVKSKDSDLDPKPEEQEIEEVGADADVEEIAALPPGDRPENIIPGADVALHQLRLARDFYADPNNFASHKAWDTARQQYNSQLRVLTGKAPKATDSTRSYAGVNNPKKPEGVGLDVAPKTPEEDGRDYEEMCRAHGAAQRAKYANSKGVN